MNSLPHFNPSLIEDTWSFKEHPIQKEKNIATQKARIGRKTITIILHFAKGVTEKQAKKLMVKNLTQAAAYASAIKLGEKIGDKTTVGLKVYKKQDLIKSTRDSANTIQEEKIEKKEAERIHKTAQSIQMSTAPVFSRKQISSSSDNDLSTPLLPINFEESGLSEPNLGVSALNTPNTPFTQTFYASGFPIAKETAVRADTVSLLLDGLRTKKQALEEEKSETDDPQRILQLKDEIGKTKAQIEIYEEHTKNATWGSTNSPRFLFQALGRETAKAEAVPILCNLRMQTVKIAAQKTHPAKEISVSRSAALSDFSHGEISLQELQDFSDLEKIFRGTYTFGDPHYEALKSFYGLYLDDGKSLDFVKFEKLIRELKIKALIAYGPERLVLESDPRLNEIINKLIENKWIVNKDNLIMNRSKVSAEDQSFLDSVVFDTSSLKSVVEERTDRLKQLCLQDLYLHFKQQPVTTSTAIYARTSLVDMTKKAKEEYGCILHERTQALDMKALLTHLDGQTIQFDIKGEGKPFIDDQGLIHMPMDCQQGNQEKTTLQTVFFNISVQGNTKNDGLQKAINEQALEKLNTMISQARLSKADKLQFANLKNALESLSQGKSDPFNAALIAGLCLLRLGAYLGANCYGGKDRTGYLLALIAYSFLKEAVKNEKNKEALLRKWGHELLSEKGIAAQVAKENADHTILKITRFDLELFDSYSLRGFMLRVAALVHFAYLKIKSTISVSPAGGQLYKARADQMQAEHRIKKIQQSPLRKLTHKISRLYNKVLIP